MRIIKKTRIEKPAKDVWQVVGTDFDKAHLWMALVPNSHAKDDGTKVEEAPVCGRVCEFTNESNGFYADELITDYSDAKMQMTIEVTPRNSPKPLPLIKNIVTISIKELDKNSSEITWDSNPQIKAWGYFIYPLFKMGLSKAFKEVLEELKHFVETGQPHPRKVKKMKLAVA